MRYRRHRFVGLACIALVIAACGSDDGAAETTAISVTETTAALPASSQPESTEAPGTSAAPEPTDAPASPACENLSEPATINVAATSTPVLTNVSIYLAEFLGLFDEAGIDLTINRLTMADALAPLAAGDIDVVATGWNTGLLNAINAGIEVKMIASTSQPDFNTPIGYWVGPKLVGPDGKVDLTKFKGATVAAGLLDTIGMPGLILHDVVSPAGVRLQDMNLVSMVATDTLPALLNGAVDSAFISSPFYRELEGKEGYAFAGGYTTKFSGTGLFAGPGLLERPEVGAVFLRVMRDVITDYLQGDYLSDPETLDALSKTLEIPAETLAVADLIQFDPDQPLEGGVERIDQLQELEIEYGGILDYTEPLDSESMFLSDWVDEASTCS